ncbi:helix-turn-helix transcriptional regulator [Pseudomonas sp. BIGb0427]|uniref:helix-turn-helix domain-containing protein n=1 Tax=Pseudomonas sp. BIGb0427 TaxID=2724470 RepID=UPI0016ABB722|nr:helix-turn-helix transcriptional regulator [Pseudomonas sp. BIGb0427]NLU60049.1 helix-turn-helix transcriptional regulator [Pseudomonas sp. BIGb0427]QPG65942.1 helix-turn-helix transcriptional regulator [Pseudomonas sp. BIGb0427]
MGIGDRLKEERERLGLSQTDFAALAGASKNSQYNYEKGERSPDANYLAAAAQQGVDVLYVVTGQRLPMAETMLASDELEMVQNVRALAEEDKGAVKRLLRAINHKSD